MEVGVSSRANSCPPEPIASDILLSPLDAMSISSGHEGVSKLPSRGDRVGRVPLSLI